jgi:sigma-B regulation protein RsbU (phosphoserine phosphatase)
VPNNIAIATVLIADDDRIARRMLGLLLGNKGFTLEYAETGADALNRARALKPDLLLLDVNMPDLDGFEICKALRADPAVAEMPIIMITALTDRDARLRGIEAGADDFISKPFDKVELAARVTTVLRLNRYRRVQEAQRLEQQLEMASAIQQLLLPRQTPKVAGLEVAARYRPAAHVGGDLYDFILRNRRLHFVVADVSGHGVASAIFMSNVRSAFRSLLGSSTDLASIAEATNERMVDDAGESGMFVTAVIGSYELDTRLMTFVNCGHPEPVIVRDNGRVETVPASAAPIGMLCPLNATPFVTIIEPGDLVCLCTDGVTEAENQARQQFGGEGLRAAVQCGQTRGIDALADSILESVAVFHSSSDLEDDVALVVMRGVDHAA